MEFDHTKAEDNGNQTVDTKSKTDTKETGRESWGFCVCATLINDAPYIYRPDFKYHFVFEINSNLKMQ